MRSEGCGAFPQSSSSKLSSSGSLRTSHIFHERNAQTKLNALAKVWLLLLLLGASHLEQVMQERVENKGSTIAFSL